MRLVLLHWDWQKELRLLWKWHHLRQQCYQRHPISSQQPQSSGLGSRPRRGDIKIPSADLLLNHHKEIADWGTGWLPSLTCSPNRLAIFKFLAQVLDLKFSQLIRSVLKVMTLEGWRPNDPKRWRTKPEQNNKLYTSRMKWAPGLYKLWETRDKHKKESGPAINPALGG